MKNMTPKSELIKLWDEVALSFINSGTNYWNDFGMKLVSLSQIQTGDNILDIGTGGGASLFPASKCVGETGSIIGIDISSKMVALTQNTIDELGILNAKVVQMDAEFLAFENQSFDKVISGFSLANIVGSENGLRDICRVLKPNGWLCMSTWGEQPHQEWLNDIVGEYLEINSSSNSVKFNDRKNVTELIESYSFKTILSIEDVTEVNYINKDTWWHEMNSNAFKGIINAIESKGEDQLESFKTKVYKGLDEFQNGDVLTFKMVVIYLIAEKEKYVF